MFFQHLPEILMPSFALCIFLTFLYFIQNIYDLEKLIVFFLSLPRANLDAVLLTAAEVYIQVINDDHFTHIAAESAQILNQLALIQGEMLLIKPVFEHTLSPFYFCNNCVCI